MDLTELEDAISHQRALRQTHQQHLRLLEQQAAEFGSLHVPAHLIHQIANLQAQIAMCDVSLTNLESQQVQATALDTRFGPGRRRALVIGVGQASAAPHLSPLAAPAAMAQTLATLLVSPVARFALPPGTILLDSAAKATDIQDAILDALDGMLPEDLLLIVFSGYAVVCDDAVSPTSVMLVTTDFHPTRATARPERYLSLAWIHNHVLQTPLLGHIVVVLDVRYMTADGLPVAHEPALQMQLATLLDGDQLSDGHATRVIFTALMPPTDEPLADEPSAFATQLKTLLHKPPRAVITIDDLWTTLQKRKDMVAIRAGVVRSTSILAMTLLTETPGPTILDPQALRDRQGIKLAARHEESIRLLQLRLKGFVGRKAERSAIRGMIEVLRPTGGYVLIKAHAGEGKSSIIAKLIEEADITTTPHHMIPLTPGPQHQLSLLRALVAQLILKHALPTTYFPDESYPAMKDYFATILRQLSDHGIEETLYVDGLDQLDPEHTGVRDLSFLPPQPPPGIVLILGSRPDETLRPLEPLYRQEYLLPSLTMSDFHAILQTHQAAVAAQDATQIYHALGGNALYLTLAANEIKAVAATNWRTFVQAITADPQSLFSTTLGRIQRSDSVLWDRVIKPVLAVLVIAQEPLNTVLLRTILKVDHESMMRGLERLGGLVSRSTNGQYALYHLKLRDYLMEPEIGASSRAFLFAHDELMTWHQHVAAWCIPTPQDGSLIWQDSSVQGEQERRLYARHHYVTHLALGWQWDVLSQVVDDGIYGRYKQQFDPSTHLYAQDLDRARDMAVHHKDLMKLWRWSLLRVSLTSRIDQWPDTFFMALAQFGRTAEALNCVELVSTPARRVSLLKKIMPCMVTEETHVMWQRVRATVDAIPVLDERTGALVDLVDALCAASNFAAARDSADAITHADHRSYALKTLVRAMCAVSDFVVARATANAIPNNWIQCYALMELGIALHIAQHPDAAITLAAARASADAIPSSGLRFTALAALVDALCAVGDFAAARSTADTILNDWIKSRALMTLVKTLHMAQHPDAPITLAHARASATAISDIGIRSSTLAGLVRALCAAGDFAVARATADTIPDTDQRSQALATLVRAWCTSGNFTAAHAAAEAIPDTAIRSNAFTVLGVAMHTAHNPDADTILAAARATANTIPYAHDRFHVLMALGMALYTVQHPESSVIMAQIRVTADTIPHDGMRSSALAILVQALCAAGDFAAARATADAIPINSMRSSARTCLMDALCASGDVATAHAIAAAIPDADNRSLAFASLVNALCTAHDFVTARATAGAIPNTSIRSSTLATLGIALHTAHHPDAAATLLAARASANTMTDAHERSQTLAALMDALRAAGDFATVRAITNAMTDAAARSQALATLVDALCAAGDFAAARATADTILNGEIQVRALTALGKAMHTAQHPDAAMTLVHARATADSIPDARLKFSALATLVDALCAASDFATARAIADTIPNTSIRSHSFTVLGMAMHTAQHPDAAMTLVHARALADAIPDARTRFSTLATLVDAWCVAGNFAAARATADAIPINSMRSRALAVLVHALWASGDLAAARTTADIIPDEDERSRALAALGRALNTMHHPDTAATLAAAYTTANTMTDAHERSQTLAALMDALCAAGDFATARAITNAIPHTRMQSQALATLVDALCAAGDFAAARATADTILNGEIQVRALTVLGKAMRKAQHPDAAVTLAAARASADAIPDAVVRFRALVTLVDTWCAASDFAAARTTADAIPDIVRKSQAIHVLHRRLTAMNHQNEVVGNVSRIWRQTTTLPELLALLPIIFPLLNQNPTLGSALFTSFAWIDDQLQI
jgi:hypothetical protein